MESKDKVISEALGKIDTELNEIREILDKKYDFKTNCKFPGGPSGDLNLRTVTSVEPLVGCLLEINATAHVYKETVEDLRAVGVEFTGPITYGGTFTIEQWKEDLVNLIKRISLKDRESTLKDKKAKLQDLYSQEKKDQIQLEELLKGL